MHIQSISISNLPPLKEVHFDCNSKVNLFIGPNASGKSTILRAIKNVDSGDEYVVVILGAEHPAGHKFALSISNDTDHRVVIETSHDWPPDTLNSGATPWDTVPLLYVPATRVSLPPQDILSPRIYRPEPYGFDLTWDDILARHFGNSLGDFNGEYVENAIDWFRGKLSADRSQQNQLREAIRVGYSCAKSVCPEVIHDDLPHSYVEFRDEGDEEEHEQGFYPTGRIDHYGMGIGTSDNILGEPLYAGVLSSGTQGTLLWVWALALKIVNHYGWTEGWEKKPAILLIDEIENHLHPTWQRRVIPALLKHFPGLQIFATTHSPFVVAGREAGQVHLLKRENGSVTATTNTEDIIGWTADEILRTMLGVEEPTDQLTVDRANRLRELRDKELLTPAEESEMNELRRQVNEDLLSKSGPLESQRERYADLMREFLLARQSDLTQDGR